MNDKGKMRELERRIDEILYYVWYPMSGFNNPYARAEYSSCTMTILKYVLQVDSKKITQYLSRLESDSMGLPTNSEHSEMVAKRLLDYKYAVEEGLK